jgi:hypothetical protein
VKAGHGGRLWTGRTLLDGDRHARCLLLDVHICLSVGVVPVIGGLIIFET